MTTTHQDTWNNYCSAWKVDSASEKQAILNQVFNPECVYRDPLAVTVGREALVKYMLEFHQMIPGGHFITRKFSSHNDRSIAEWDMCAGDGTPICSGISYGEFDATGQLTSANGFFELPEAG